MSDTPKKSTRILAFDLLRGYFMVSIILNHLQWYPSGLDWVAWRGSLFVSAAEGFFFISGLVLGIIRGRKLITAPFKDAALLLIKRGVLLYGVSVILMLLFTFIGWFFLDNPGLKAGIRPITEPIWQILIGALSMNYIYGWADFLRLYAVFIIAAPFALLLLRKNKWYILTAINIGLWALFPFAAKFSGHSTELLMILSWQLIFFVAMTIGFYWEPLAKKWEALTKKARRWILLPVLGLAGLTLLGNIVLSTITALHLPGFYNAQILESSLWPNFDKQSLGIARLILFGLWFTLGFYIFNRFEPFIKKWLGWILLSFGQNSLYVYILHAVLLFFAHLILPPGSNANVAIHLIGSLAILGLILFAVKKKFLFKIIPR